MRGHSDLIEHSSPGPFSRQNSLPPCLPDLNPQLSYSQSSLFPARERFGAVGPKQPSLRPPVPPTLPQTLPRATPEPRRSLAVAPLIADKRCYGSLTAHYRGSNGVATESIWSCQRDRALGMGRAAHHVSRCPTRTYGHWGIRNLGLFRVSGFGLRISAFTRPWRGGGSGALWAHQCSRQCAGRCESRWPSWVSAHQTGRRKAR